MKLIRWVIPVALVLLCWNAFAGQYSASPVFIDDLDTHTAGGNLYATRFTPDELQMIGCALGSGTRGTYGYCSANNGKAVLGRPDVTEWDVESNLNLFDFVM